MQITRDAFLIFSDISSSVAPNSTYVQTKNYKDMSDSAVYFLSYC